MANKSRKPVKPVVKTLSDGESRRMSGRPRAALGFFGVLILMAGDDLPGQQRHDDGEQRAADRAERGGGCAGAAVFYNNAVGRARRRWPGGDPVSEAGKGPALFGKRAGDLLSSGQGLCDRAAGLHSDPDLRRPAGGDGPAADHLHRDPAGVDERLSAPQRDRGRAGGLYRVDGPGAGGHPAHDRPDCHHALCVHGGGGEPGRDAAAGAAEPGAAAAAGARLRHGIPAGPRGTHENSYGHCREQPETGAQGKEGPEEAGRPKPGTPSS